MSQSIEEDVKIGFIALKELERGYRGALLVTDRNSAPVEFRCTSAVSPTRMQRILYGKRLVPHIALQLVGKPLHDAMTEKPAIFVSQDDVFLGLRDLLEKPVVRARRRMKETSRASVPDVGPSTPQLVEDDPFAFVALESHRKHPEDSNTARELLRDCEDLIEPFDRIEEALKADEERTE